MPFRFGKKEQGHFRESRKEARREQTEGEHQKSIIR